MSLNQPLAIDDLTLLAQRRASDPASSAWVSANAGSGKTFVLAQRVKRLLLAGVDPDKILCLTYTKAAAANMANRILNDLGQWVRMPEPELRTALSALDGRPSNAVSGKDIDRARRLFAHAIETPGGLQIKTIHAFCDALLHRFPFEAGIAGNFRIVDETEQRTLIDTALKNILLSKDAALKEDLKKLLPENSPHDLKKSITACLPRAKALFQSGQNLQASIYSSLGLLETLTQEQIHEDILGGMSPSCGDMIAALEQTGEKRDAACAAGLKQVLQNPKAARAKTYLDIFLTKEGAFRKPQAFLSAAFKKTSPRFAEILNGEFTRLAPLHDKIILLGIAQNTCAFLRIAYRAWHEIENAKAASGLLDFSDIIERSGALLNGEASAWVRYKLDQGVDHILIDEAQDTSAQQWQVISGLWQEFFAGESARQIPRTIFAVGDDKQSIFSFQGADPQLFYEEKRRAAKASADIKARFEDVSLNLSFRSSPAVLNAVDRVFTQTEAAKGVTSAEHFPPHEAAKRHLPGLVELWPLETAAPKNRISGFEHPFLATGSDNPRARLALKIAAAVAHEISNSTMKAGDVLILVRTRNSLFEALIRELKQAGLPVAGADRLVLNEHIAVMDLLALGNAVLLPEDDLTFAALLKSPLFGFDEDDLFQLAYERSASLYETLALRAHERNIWQQGFLCFSAWRQRAKTCRPYEFFSQVLGRDGGRRAIYARLGREAGEVLDEFLNAALAFEKNAAPTLQNFLKFMRETRADIKREMQQGQNEVRVMTVHNAKGLEAKWVILADTADIPGKAQLDEFYDMESKNGPALVWGPGEKYRIGPLIKPKEKALHAQEDEYRRLLYVALTRAEERLTICGANTKEKIPDDCWYGFAQTALIPLCAEEHGENGNIARWIMRTGETAVRPAQNKLSEFPPAREQPAWLIVPPKSALPPLILNPSLGDNFFEHEIQGGISPEQARERGILLHRLLEHLPRFPAEERLKRAKNFLKSQAAHFPESEQEALAIEAANVLSHQDLQKFFDPENSLAEVPLHADIVLPNGRRAIVQGQIDRLLITPDALHIIDFKSGRAPAPGFLPKNYLAQLSLYREALKSLKGTRRIHCHLLWTAVPRLDDIGAGNMNEALAKIA